MLIYIVDVSVGVRHSVVIYIVDVSVGVRHSVVICIVDISIGVRFPCGHLLSALEQLYISLIVFIFLKNGAFLMKAESDTYILILLSIENTMRNDVV